MSLSPFHRLSLGFLATLVIGFSQSASADIAATALTPPAIIDLTTDATLRFTVQVMINGHGPYRFMVDTGSDRSSVSSKIAKDLQLPMGDPVKVHSMSGASMATTVKIQTLEIMPGLAIHDFEAPVFSAQDLGADGLIGVDSLQGRQVVIDFTKQTMSIEVAQKHPLPVVDEAGAFIVRAKSKYGQLILVDSSLGERPLRVVLDTGAQYAVGNSAMRRIAARVQAEAASQPVEMLSVVGKSVSADYTRIHRIKLGGVVLLNTPIAFSDAHPFRRFGLEQRPAMLLGMDMLRLFRRVTIDFANRRVSFVPPSGLTEDLETAVGRRIG